MTDDKIPLKVDSPEVTTPRFEYQHTKVAPFPRARFLKFMENLKVQSKDFGLVPFRLLGSQLYILDEICKGLEEGVTSFVILKARQLGSSTFFLALDLYWSMEHGGLLGVFITHQEQSRDDFRSAVEVFFAETPRKYLVKYVRHNRNLLILRNASKFRYLIAGTSENRKGGLGRSGSANYVHATESAFYGNGDDLSEFKSQTSSLYPHRLYVEETTANGFNHFWDRWEMAKSDPTKRAIFVGWWRDERNQIPISSPFFEHYMTDGLKSTLTPLERKRVRNVRDEYGFEVSLQQVCWYRHHLATEKDGDQALMDQEFPWTEEDAFQATGSKFFTAEAMTQVTREAKKQPYKAYRYKLTHKFEETMVRNVQDSRAELKIWEESSRFGYYSVGCDPAYGSSDEADRTCISVWRCFSDGMIQVAEFCTPEVSTYQCAWVLAHLCGYYGTNYIMPVLEITGPGQAVFDELLKIQRSASEIRPNDDTHGIRNILQNMRQFLYRRIDNPSGGQLAYQWRSSEELKRRAMNQYKNAIELGRAIPKSVPLCEEMRRIVNDEGHIGAEGRSKDDRVMAAAFALQGWNNWVQPKLKGMGMSMARSREADERGGVEPVDRLITNYLKRVNIMVQT